MGSPGFVMPSLEHFFSGMARFLAVVLGCF